MLHRDCCVCSLAKRVRGGGEMVRGEGWGVEGPCEIEEYGERRGRVERSEEEED